jgi:hypothetical protein
LEHERDGDRLSQKRLCDRTFVPHVTYRSCSHCRQPPQRPLAPTPASYLAQERPDSVVRGYLDSLEVRTIALESWNAMPLLLNAINPA